MGMVRGTLAGCLVAVAVSALPASAAKTSLPKDGRVVDELIAVMRQDARQQAHRRPGAVTVTTGCCGFRTTSVHHAAHLQPGVLVDSYILRIKTQGNEVLGLAVSEALREAARTTSEGTVRGEVKLEATLERSPGAHSRWHGRLNGEENGGIMGGPGRPSSGTSSQTVCAPAGPVRPRRFSEMLEIVRNARRHVSSVGDVRLWDCD